MAFLGFFNSISTRVFHLQLMWSNCAVKRLLCTELHILELEIVLISLMTLQIFYYINPKYRSPSACFALGRVRGGWSCSLLQKAKIQRNSCISHLLLDLMLSGKTNRKNLLGGHLLCSMFDTTHSTASQLQLLPNIQNPEWKKTRKLQRINAVNLSRIKLLFYK